MLKISERLSAITRMKECGLSLKHTARFSVKALLDACDRIDAFMLKSRLIGDCGNIQEELISNPLFARLYSKLMDNGFTNYEVEVLLNTAEMYQEKITDYDVEKWISKNLIETNDAKAKYEYLKFYSNLNLDAQQRELLLNNLTYIHNLGVQMIADFSESQRLLLCQDYFYKYVNADRDTVQSVMNKLDSNKPLQAALVYLADKGVCFGLDLTDICNLFWLRETDVELFKRIFVLLGNDSEYMSSFMELWLENGALEFEINWFNSHAESLSEDKREMTLETKLGYLNAIYSRSLTVPLDELQSYQNNVLFFAIANKKHRFLKMISENFETFRDLDAASILFDPAFYKRCNLNALSAKNLSECKSERNRKRNLNDLQEREYTFGELKTLEYASPVYHVLYDKLQLSRVDDKLTVIRQLLKKNLLSEDTTPAEVEILAARLSERSLAVWREKNLSHIKGLKLTDVIRVLLAYDEIQKFIPDMQTWEEVVFAARNAKSIKAYADWEQVKTDLISADQAWQELAGKLNITETFIKEHKPHILNFIYNEGAEMSLSYYEFTDKKEAFRRVLQAELMGELKTLKYYKDDLQREIGYPVNKCQKQHWSNNSTLMDRDAEITEHDDFYSTLRLGMLPRRTCLSYLDGAQCECLLSGFDSNKKILLARRNGKVVGRAVLRLTKGMFEKSENDDTERESIEFVDLMATETPGKIEATEKREFLTVFLEHPYFSGLSESEEKQIKKLFVRLVTEKAEQLGAIPVLSELYSEAYSKDEFIRMWYYLYISKSKSGKQYLDSLSGPASASDEGSYGKNRFLVFNKALSR